MIGRRGRDDTGGEGGTTVGVGAGKRTVGGASDGDRGAGLLLALASRALNCLFRIQRAHCSWQNSLVPRFLKSIEHCWQVMCSARSSNELLGIML